MSVLSWFGVTPAPPSSLPCTPAMPFIAPSYVQHRVADSQIPSEGFRVAVRVQSDVLRHRMFMAQGPRSWRGSQPPPPPPRPPSAPPHHLNRESARSFTQNSIGSCAVLSSAACHLTRQVGALERHGMRAALLTEMCFPLFYAKAIHGSAMRLPDGCGWATDNRWPVPKGVPK